MNVLALIPARAGSKGIKLKNIQKINGKPLIAYSIEAAKKSKSVNRIIVSTDSSKIAKIAKSFGAEIPFLRPKKLSSDKSSGIETIVHALDFLKNSESYEPDIVVILQPTSPIRSSKIIDKSILMLKPKKITSVITTMKIKTHPYQSFWKKSGYLKPFIQNNLEYYQRQKLPSLYYPTGSVYSFKISTLKKFGTIYGPNIKPLEIEDDYFNIDIDTPLDFFLAEQILKNQKKFKIT